MATSPRNQRGRRSSQTEALASLQFALGELVVYGPNVADVLRRAGDDVDKGTQPADLPVEQPSKFEFLINMKTATALGSPCPPSLPVRADAAGRLVSDGNGINRSSLQGSPT
jgi:hypothetical protein